MFLYLTKEAGTLLHRKQHVPKDRNTDNNGLSGLVLQPCRVVASFGQDRRAWDGSGSMCVLTLLVLPSSGFEAVGEGRS